MLRTFCLSVIGIPKLSASFLASGMSDSLCLNTRYCHSQSPLALAYAGNIAVTAHRAQGGAKVDSTTSQSSSEIVNFIRESNKIYFGTLNIEQRKTLGITVLHAANHEKIMNDETFKSKFISMGSKKFYLDESYITNLLSGTDGDKLFDELKSKFLEGDLTQMFVYIWEMILSIGEEDDLEIELVESSAERYGFEKPLISETICTYYFIIY